LKSLIKLYASPAPLMNNVSTLLNNFHLPPHNSSQPASQSTTRRLFSRPSRSSLQSTSTTDPSTSTIGPEWPIVPTTMSTAGRVVVLRLKDGIEDNVEAVTVEDQTLRTVMFGDADMHMMKVYKRRIDALATKAVTVSDV
jgi:hypothetical protein